MRRPRPGTGRGRQADQARGRRADGQRHRRRNCASGAICPRSSRCSPTAATGRCTPAASPTSSGIRRVLAPPFSSVFSALGAGNMHAAAHPRARRPGRCCSTRPAAAARRLRGVQRDRRRAGGKGPGDLLRQGLTGRRRASPARAGHALRQPAGDDGRGRRPHPDAQRRATCSTLIGPVPRGLRRTVSARAASRPRPASGSHTVRVASYVEGRRSSSTPRRRRRRRPPTAGGPARRCHFVGVDGPVETPVYDEHALSPATVDRSARPSSRHPTTTYLVEPGWRLSTGAHGADLVPRKD